MPERGRHQQRSDEYAEHKSRDEDLWLPAADRRPKESRQRDVTTGPHRDPPAHRDHHPEGPSRLSHETSVYQCEREHCKRLYNLRYLLTSRGLCQLMELFVNLLIVICAGVPYSNQGGYRDLASLGGLYYYHFGGAGAFTGADAERVKELDRLFHELKRPPYAFAMACGGALMAYACAALALGVFRVPYRWPPVLLGEALLSLLVGLGYIAALAFYFIRLQETYNSSVCREREQMYKSKGHKGFECRHHGADIAAGLFGVLGVFVFISGAVLAVRAFRSVRELKKQRTNEDSHF